MFGRHSTFTGKNIFLFLAMVLRRRSWKKHNLHTVLAVIEYFRYGAFDLGEKFNRTRSSHCCDFIRTYTGVGQNDWNTTILSTLFKNSVSSKILIQVSLFWYIFPVNMLFLLLNCVFSIIFQI